jgi:hypothetical protein
MTVSGPPGGLRLTATNGGLALNVRRPFTEAGMTSFGATYRFTLCSAKVGSPPN